MRNILVTPATVEPFDVAAMKSFLRVTHSHEDALITGMIKAARILCENYSRMSFMRQTWKQEFQVPGFNREYLSGATMRGGYGGMGGFGVGFPSSEALLDIGIGGGGVYDPDNVNEAMTLNKGPVAGITSFSLTGDNLSPLALTNADYTLDGNRLTWGPDFYDLTDGRNAGAITYTTGADSANDFAAQFADVVLAIQMTAAVAYEHRGLSDVTIPPAARQILLQYRSIIVL